MYQGSFYGVVMLFQEFFQGRSFQDVLRTFQECFKKISRVFQESFKGVSRKGKGNINVSKVFQGCSKQVSRMFQESFKGVSRMFQASFRGDLGKIEGCSQRPSMVIQVSFEVSKRSSKGVSREFQGSFKDILRQFQECLKKVSTVFQDNFKEKVSRCFKSVSMKFCFAILFFHGSHLRRRACFILASSSFWKFLVGPF